MIPTGEIIKLVDIVHILTFLSISAGIITSFLTFAFASTTMAFIRNVFPLILQIDLVSS
jgi:hypothetical protein